MRTRTRYAKNEGFSLAYQVIGEGGLDVLFVPGFVSNVDHYWEMPVVPRLFEWTASYSRLIVFDKRGTGRSDPVSAVPTTEERIGDMRAVLDAAGSERAALFGISEGGPMSLLFAATYPERTSALALYGTSPKFSASAGWEWGWSPEDIKRWLWEIERRWGEGALIELFAPSAAGDPSAREVWADYQREGASPGMGRAVLQALVDLDVRAILSSVHVPTLILHRQGERVARIEAARYMAEQIPNARLVEFPGEDHLPFIGDSDPIFEELEEFLTGERREREPDRMLATVLFTDIVASTERAARLGDRRWRALLEHHDALVRRHLERYRGREVKSTGDGFIATFDGPARAIKCAVAIRDGLRGLEMEIRAGLHTGECELRNGDVGGIAVHIGARVAALANPGEVLVSRTVKDLLVGSPVRFADRGTRALKGVPGKWQLYAIQQ